MNNAGDVNGDGFGDLLIGAPYADPQRELTLARPMWSLAEAGGFAGSLESRLADWHALASAMKGAAGGDYAGDAVSGAGDVNGDGFDDLLIGAPRGRADAGVPAHGAAYVVFGGAGVGSGGPIELSELGTLNGSPGFVMNGAAQGDVRGPVAVSGAGDVNGDGFADLLIGASWGRPARMNSNIRRGLRGVWRGGGGQRRRHRVELSRARWMAALASS